MCYVEDSREFKIYIFKHTVNSLGDSLECECVYVLICGGKIKKNKLSILDCRKHSTTNNEQSLSLIFFKKDFPRERQFSH